LIPTKTSMLVVQSRGRDSGLSMMGVQVWRTFVLEYCFLFVFASLRSISSLASIARFHLVVIAVREYDWPPMTRSHLSVQSRYAASDSRMRFRRAIPLCCGGLVPCSFVVGVIFPHPRMWPMAGTVQLSVGSGQACFVSSHIVAFASVSHSVSTRASDSVVSVQCGQVARIS